MIPFSDSTSLYFYSALLQGNAALVALVAMFLVYQKQHLNSEFDRLENIIIDYLCKTANVTANYGNIYNFENFNEDICKDLDSATKEKLKKTLEHSSWKARFRELKITDEQRKNLWQNAVLPIRLIFLILGASVIMLPLSDQVHNYILVEAILFGIYVLAELFTLGLLFRFIKGQFI